ncbi:hypothetical protein [Comamonas thiooxydans]|nr:hypothetical protein [Comamonas thiooxydans]
MSNDTNRIIDELFGPPLRRERKISFLTLYNPWTRMYHIYLLGQEGLKRINTIGPVNLRDAKGIESAYQEEIGKHDQ